MCASLHLVPDPLDNDGEPRGRPPIRVVVADAHQGMRRGLRLVLDAEDDIDVIAEAGDPASAVAAIDHHIPDVIALDLNMSNSTEGRQLLARADEIGVVVLGMQDVPALAQRALALGALGFVRKQFADVELAPAIRAAARREVYIPSAIALPPGPSR